VGRDHFKLSQDHTKPTLIGNSTNMDEGMEPQYSPRVGDSNAHSFIASSKGNGFSSTAFIYESAPDLEKIKEFANERYTGKLKQLGKQVNESMNRLTKQKRIMISGG